MGAFDAGTAFDAVTPFDESNDTTLVTLIELGTPPTVTLSAVLALVLGSVTRGILGTNQLSDVYWSDISSTTLSASIRRGIDRDLEQAQAGSCTLRVNNSSRAFDPNNTAGVYYPWLTPQSQVRVTQDTKVLFTGQIETVSLEHGDYGKTSTVTLTCADALARVTQDVKWTPEAEHSGYARITRILQKIGWSATTYLLPGTVTFQAAVEQSGDALSQIDDVVFAERGMFFAAISGILVFLPASYWTGLPVSQTFSDAASASIRYSSIDESVGTEMLVNRVELTRGETVVGAGNLASQGTYGLRTMARNTTVSTNAAMTTLADSIIAQFATPGVRYSRTTIATDRFSRSVREQILGLELGSIVTVVRTPLGTGTPSTITRNQIVIGIEHELAPKNIESSYTFGDLP